MKSQLVRYAYGESDEKPHWSFWLLLAGMCLIVGVALWLI